MRPSASCSDSSCLTRGDTRISSCRCLTSSESGVRPSTWVKTLNRTDGSLERSSLPMILPVGCSAWLGVFISAPAKSTSSRIELYPREFVFCPYRGIRVKGLRIIERRYCHVNPFRTDLVLDKQRRATTRGERAYLV